MAGKVKDLVETLKGPVTKEILGREGKKKSKVQFIPHDYKGETEPSAPGEGKDSEGKEKVLHLSEAPAAEADEELA